MDEKNEIIHQENYIAIVKEGLRKLGSGDKLQVNCINSIKVEIKGGVTPPEEPAQDNENFILLFDSLPHPRLRNLVCLAARVAKRGRTMDEAAAYAGEGSRTLRTILDSKGGQGISRTDVYRGLIGDWESPGEGNERSGDKG